MIILGFRFGLVGLAVGEVADGHKVDGMVIGVADGVGSQRWSSRFSWDHKEGRWGCWERGFVEVVVGFRIRKLVFPSFFVEFD